MTIPFTRRLASAFPTTSTFLMDLSGLFGLFMMVALTPAVDAAGDDEALTKRFEKDILVQANAARTATAALRILDDFEAAQPNGLPAELAARVRTQRERYRLLQEQRLVKFGGQWVSADELQGAAQKCLQQLEVAKEALANRDGERAFDALDRATRHNPNALEPHFLEGMLWSMRGNCKPALAAKAFESVLRVHPDYFPALNNAALSYIKQKDQFGKAFTHWKRLSELQPRCPELVHNLNRLEREANAGRLAIPKHQHQRFVALAAKVRNAAGVDLQHGLGKGWLYSQLVQAWGEGGEAVELDDESLPEPRPEDSTPATFVATGFGAGFVVAAGYVVTSRQVVENDALGPAQQVMVRLGTTGEPSRGRVRAVSRTEDLALVQVEGMDAAPLPLSGAAVDQGAEARSYSFAPDLDLLYGPRQVTGKVTTEASQVDPGLIRLEIPTPCGLSGGPVCDLHGQVVGLMTGMEPMKAGYALVATSGPRIVAFLNRHIPDQPAADNLGAGVGWKEWDARMRTSLVFLEVQHRAKSMGIAKAVAPTARNDQADQPVDDIELQDVSCCTCQGWGYLRCTNSNCANGQVVEKVMIRREMFVGGQGSAMIPATELVRGTCGVCGGNGLLRCRPCGTTGIGPDIGRPRR